MNRENPCQNLELGKDLEKSIKNLWKPWTVKYLVKTYYYPAKIREATYFKLFKL